MTQSKVQLMSAVLARKELEMNKMFVPHYWSRLIQHLNSEIDLAVKGLNNTVSTSLKFTEQIRHFKDTLKANQAECVNDTQEYLQAVGYTNVVVESDLQVDDKTFTLTIKVSMEF